MEVSNNTQTRRREIDSEIPILELRNLLAAVKNVQFIHRILLACGFLLVTMRSDNEVGGGSPDIVASSGITAGLMESLE